MSAITVLRTLKARIAPKLVLNRTPLDLQIGTLAVENQELREQRDTFLRQFDELRRQRDELARVNSTLVRERNASHWRGDGNKAHAFMGYHIPIDLMMMTGGGPETFDTISASHTVNLERWIGLDKSHTVLEIGCGIGRDAIPLTYILRDGRYVGVDIIKRSIEWCSQNIAARNPNFSFYHFDVEDQLHNAGGSTRTTDITLPVDDGSVDRIILFSVFTHMLARDVEHYLREFKRVLKKDGLVYATTFIFDEAILRSAQATNLTPFDLRFEHEIDTGCRINDPVHPLGAVAYTREAWDGMIRRSGLRHANPPLKGAWSGYYPDPQDGQDVVILASRM